MKKRFIAAACAMSAILILGGCGSSAKNAAEATTEEEIVVEEKVEIGLTNPEEYVKPGTYTGLTVDGVRTEVTDEDIQDQIDSFLEEYVEYEEITDRDTVQEGDFVNIDFETTIDGETEAADTAEDYDVELGSGELVYGENFDMETPLIGKKVGDTVTLDLTFPDDEDTFDDAAGKAANVTIKINKIEKQVVPELTDELVQEATEYKTVEEYKKGVQEELKETITEDGEDYNRRLLLAQITDASEQLKEFPEDMVERQTTNFRSDIEMAAQSGFYTVDELTEIYYPEGIEEAAKDQLKQSAVVKVIASELGIEATEDDYNELIQSTLDEGDYSSEEEILEETTKEEIMDYILEDKVAKELMKDTKVNVAYQSLDEAYEAQSES